MGADAVSAFLTPGSILRIRNYVLIQVVQHDTSRSQPKERDAIVGWGPRYVNWSAWYPTPSAPFAYLLNQSRPNRTPYILQNATFALNSPEYSYFCFGLDLRTELTTFSIIGLAAYSGELNALTPSSCTQLQQENKVPLTHYKCNPFPFVHLVCRHTNRKYFLFVRLVQIIWTGWPSNAGFHPVEI